MSGALIRLLDPDSVLKAKIVEFVGRGEFGERTVRFHGDADLYAAFERIGHVPLPPYIKRTDSPADRDRYADSA